MNCAQVRHLLPGYLDGALPDSVGPKGHLDMGQHLGSCPTCRQEQARYMDLSAMMANLGPIAPPAKLSISIRVAVAEARGAEGFAGRMSRWKDSLELVLKNILEPIALPATAGALVALVVFSLVYQVLGVSIGLGAATPDSTSSNLLQPARLEILAGFRMSNLGEMSREGGQHPLLVEATVSAEGEAVSYRVLSGDVNAATQRELDQVLLFSRFRPEMSFGKPTSRGRVVLSFNQICVRG